MTSNGVSFCCWFAREEVEVNENPIIRSKHGVAFATSLAFVQQAHACPDGQYERCVFNACVCLPEIGGTPGQIFEKGKKGAEGLGGVPLEGWTIASASAAREDDMWLARAAVGSRLMHHEPLRLRLRLIRYSR